MSTETEIRAAIVARINTVSNRGNVYDHQRYSDDWKRHIELFGYSLAGATILRTWFVSCEAVLPDGNLGLGQGLDYAITVYRYVMRGYFGVVDSAHSEETALAIAIAVQDALNNAAVFSGTDSCTASFAGLNFTYTTWGGVLCHLAEITQEFTV